MTYEGARAIIGPFLGSLGASATIVSLVAGFGEMVGYGLRSISEYFADKTQILGRHFCWICDKHARGTGAGWLWPETGPLAAALVVAERTGSVYRLQEHSQR